MHHNHQVKGPWQQALARIETMIACGRLEDARCALEDATPSTAPAAATTAVSHTGAATPSAAPASYRPPRPGQAAAAHERCSTPHAALAYLAAHLAIAQGDLLAAIALLEQQAAASRGSSSSCTSQGGSNATATAVAPAEQQPATPRSSSDGGSPAAGAAAVLLGAQLQAAAKSSGGCASPAGGAATPAALPLAEGAAAAMCAQLLPICRRLQQLQAAALAGAGRGDWPAAITAAERLVARLGPLAAPGLQAQQLLLQATGLAHLGMQAAGVEVRVAQPARRSCLLGEVALFEKSARLLRVSEGMAACCLGWLHKGRHVPKDGTQTCPHTHAHTLQVLDRLLTVAPFHADALWARAHAHADAGAATAAFLDLQKLQQLQPGYPGLTMALQQAALRAARSRPPPRLAASTRHAQPPVYERLRRGSSGGGSRGVPSAHSGPASSGVAACLRAAEVLGVAPGASDADVRRAWRAAAARHHPDKWVGRLQAEREAAEERFKEAAAAYEALMAGA